MNELGNEPRKEYRQTYPKYVECSNCKDDRLLAFIQTEHKLTQPLCNKCLNDAPAALVDLIDRMDDYITKLEVNRDILLACADGLAEGIDVNSPILTEQIELAKTLTRP